MASQIVKGTCEKLWERNKDDCSRFVRAVAEAHGIKIKGNANSIVKQIQQSPWRMLKDGIEAGKEASLGKLVIAGTEGKKHGHVVIIVPGNLWKGKYPKGYWGKLKSIGGYGSTINWSWNKIDIHKVKYASRSIKK